MSVKLLFFHILLRICEYFRSFYHLCRKLLLMFIHDSKKTISRISFIHIYSRITRKSPFISRFFISFKHFTYTRSLQALFCKFIDSRDNEKVIVTHIYLLVGVGFPVLVSNFIQNDAVALSGIVSLGIGDTFASLIGFYFGKMKIPYRHKTIEGTLAC